jgi:hypothetical protein
MHVQTALAVWLLNAVLCVYACSTADGITAHRCVDG